jgi:hypothetical protein
MGLGVCLVDTGNYATLELLPFILLLSFPAGALVLLLGAVIIDPGHVNPALDYSLLWLVAFAAGYCQWFWLCPKLFGKREITTLGLTQSHSLPAVASTPRQRLVPSTKAPARIKLRPIAHFDGLGRTPLERAIEDSCRRKRSSEMLAKKRCDFPRVNRLPGHLC